jgi:site-specific recombinase XerD
MSSRATFRLMFYINRTRPTKLGEFPINCRITINGKSVAVYTKRNVKPDIWGAGGLCRGKTKEALELNNFLSEFKAIAYRRYQDLDSVCTPTPEILRDALLSKNKSKSISICEVWEDHVSNLKQMIGKNNTHATYIKYNAGLTHIKEFLKTVLKLPDMPLKMINHQFIMKFEIFLRSTKMISYNTTIKYLQNFKRVFLIGVKNGWVQSDPFAGFKLNLEETDRTYLTEDELQNIMGLEILIPRLELVRDIFIFSCFSGLAYSDIFKLKGSELERDPNGTLWVKTRRQKTKVKSQIPLLNVPKAIIEKYCDLSILMAESKVLPVFSNQKLNAYLKEIQMMARLEKNLTFHVARHTFATTVTMTNGVPIESVAKMMGHKNIKTTQHYARIVDSKINNDMIDLANRIGTKFSFAV